MLPMYICRSQHVLSAFLAHLLARTVLALACGLVLLTWGRYMGDLI